MMHRGLGVTVGSALLLLLGAGCDEDRPPPPRPDFHRAPAAESAATDPALAPREFRRPAPDLRDRPSGAAHPSPLTVTETRELPAMRETPERDLGAELGAAMGNPGACIPAGASGLPRHATVAITAHVSVTGIITRASARAPGFPPEMASCLARRAEALHMRGPIPDGPRVVQANLEIAAAPAPAAAAPGSAPGATQP